MILHVIPDEKFIAYLKSSIEEVAPSQNMWRILSNRSSLKFTIQDECTKQVTKSYFDSGEFRSDLGHDWRYAIDATKMNDKLNWQADETFETGIRKTVEWYLEHKKT